MKRANLLIVLLSMMIFGCGGANSGTNQFGNSMRIIGFFTDNTGATGLSGLVTSLSDGPYEAAVGVQNNITGSGTVTDPGLYIKITSIRVDYRAPSNSPAIPSREYPVSLSIEPDGKGYIEFFILPSDIIQYINDHRSSFPETPFQMNATVTVFGVTSAGNGITDTAAFFFEIGE
jgi:hypothetical protein